MPFVLLSLVIVLAVGSISFAEQMQQNHDAHVVRVEQQQLGVAINMSVHDAINAAQAATVNGQLTAPPADYTTQRSSCGVTDAANAAEPDCAQIIKSTIHFSGLTNRTGGNPAPGANGIAAAIGNVNTATVASGGTFQRVLAFTVTAKLYDASVTTLNASRTASGTLQIISVCDAISNCAQQTAQISFDGWRDSNGQHDVAAVEGASGRCNPADATCSVQGMDNATVDAGVTPDDGRPHLQVACYDPNFVGNGGTEPGDRCNPTGNPAVGPQNGDSFTNQTMTNDSATNGNFSR